MMPLLWLAGCLTLETPNVKMPIIQNSGAMEPGDELKLHSTTEAAGHRDEYRDRPEKMIIETSLIQPSKKARSSDASELSGGTH